MFRDCAHQRYCTKIAMSIFAKLNFNIIQRRMAAEFCPQFINHARIIEAQVDGNAMLNDGGRSDLCHGMFDFTPEFFEDENRAVAVTVDQRPRAPRSTRPAEHRTGRANGFR